MSINKKYCFKKNDYNPNGFHQYKDDYLFLDFIRECESDFFQEFYPFFGNGLFANISTMNLIKSCSNFDDNEIIGMESLDGEVDIDLNLKLENKSEFRTVYAIGSSIKGKEDEPVWLVVDDNLKDSEFILKYVPDDGNEEEKFVPSPKEKIIILK